MRPPRGCIDPDEQATLDARGTLHIHQARCLACRVEAIALERLVAESVPVSATMRTEHLERLWQKVRSA